jgi:anaerobic selenocysteine-containing dehydrogenase
MAVKKPITEVVRSVCRVCSRSCGILVHLQDGQVVKVEGAPDTPKKAIVIGTTGGDICIMGEVAPERLYHPNRLKYPQKRVGERGEGNWQRISWDEALDTIAEKLNSAKKRYGAEAVSFVKGHREFFCDYVVRLANVFGTPNVVAGADHVCYVPTAVGSLITYGYDGVADLMASPSCVVWWGRRGKPPLKEGAKLIVVNVLKTEAATMADVWLQPRPATDLALVLGMLYVIVHEELYDKAFVEKWTFGFDKLREHVQQYPPEKVEQITWVPAAKIAEAARLYARVRPACIKAGNAIEDNVNSVQCSRALAIMSAITGNLDVPGGVIEVQGVIDEMPGRKVTLWDKMPKEQQQKKLGAGEGFLPRHPLWELVADMPVHVHPQYLVKAILEEDPYPIKALCVFGSNPLLTWSNAKEVHRAFKKLDFLAVADLVMTPTAALADIVLPVASYLEEDGVDVQRNALGLPYVQVLQKVAQIGECWSDMKILIELAKKLGLREYFWEDVRSFLDAYLKPVGMTFEEFRQQGIIQAITKYRKYEKGGFNTPSHKVEIYSSLCEQWGYDPLPTYHEPPETPYSAPELAKEYPLILTSCHEDYFMHSQDRHLETLRKIKPGPISIIHPETAAKLGIGDGDSIYIETERGRIKQIATLSAGIHPRVVSASYAWWFPEKGVSELYGWEESNINILTDDKPPYNPEMGSTNLRGMVCKVYKKGEDT